ncbi:MAG: S8 family serine peptidase [Candidatus Nanopelagicales bacterium]
MATKRRKPTSDQPDRPEIPAEFALTREQTTPRVAAPQRRPARPSLTESALPADPGRPRAEGAAPPASPVAVPTSPDLVADSVISRPLAELMTRAEGTNRMGVVIELRAGHPQGVDGAGADVERLLGELDPPPPMRRSRGYITTALTSAEVRDLARSDQLSGAGDAATGDPSRISRAPRWAIHRMWPNFEINALIHRTIVTTKCDAAHRSFDATGDSLIWAVLDSGIDANHRHFTMHANLQLPDGLVHKSFLAGTTDTDALTDAAGHGTHVAGILAGEQVATRAKPIIAATWYHDDRGDTAVQEISLQRISGMAPHCRLLSCKVLRDDGSGDLAALLEALEYIQDLNNGGRELRVHGVNLSVGYPFDPSWFSTGLTPVCREVDRLVRGGVLVVVAAGNTGYGYALDPQEQQMRLGFDMTINDPGNTERALTVGSTSTMPHLTGVSYFSSKGPTGDGRLKPDLVAPGERVVSAGAGALLAKAQAVVPAATYVENSGTSMAAPHVSGAAAAFLSVHREFVGRPEDAKQVLVEAATDLGRARTFQGRGLLDVMRAIQSV